MFHLSYLTFIISLISIVSGSSVFANKNLKEKRLNRKTLSPSSSEVSSQNFFTVTETVVKATTLTFPIISPTLIVNKNAVKTAYDANSAKGAKYEVIASASTIYPESFKPTVLKHTLAPTSSSLAIHSTADRILFNDYSQITGANGRKPTATAAYNSNSRVNNVRINVDVPEYVLAA